MSEKKPKPKRIVPDVYYTLSEIVANGFIPFLGKNHTPHLRIVTLDMEGKNVLKTIVSGEGNGTRYTIKGSNIINFLHLVENGKYKV